MRKAYKIVLTPTEDGYMVTVPDFNCNTQGEDIAEALFMARDVIGAMGMAWEDMGKEIPAPNSVEFETADGEIVTYVDVDFAEYRRKHDNRMVKKNCTIPFGLCEAAEKAGINFSGVLREALKEKLNYN